MDAYYQIELINSDVVLFQFYVFSVDSAFLELSREFVVEKWTALVMLWKYCPGVLIVDDHDHPRLAEHLADVVIIMSVQMLVYAGGNVGIMSRIVNVK